MRRLAALSAGVAAAMLAACSIGDLSGLSGADDDAGAGAADGAQLDATSPGTDSSPDTDAGGAQLDATSPGSDSGGTVDSGTDAGVDSGVDAGTDSGTDSGTDAGVDSGVDAGTCNPGTVTNGLVAYYPLDETSGAVAHDCSGHAHDGTLLGATNSGWAAGKVGGGFTFDGTSQCFDLGMDPELLVDQGSFTVSAWVSARSFGTGSTATYIMGRAFNANVAGWRFGAKDTASHYYVFGVVPNSTGVLTDTGTPSGQALNTWVHVAGVYDGAKVYFYLNGASTGSTTAPSPMKVDSTATVRIGCRNDDTSYLAGSLDEIRIYSRALTQSELTTIAAP